MRHRSRLLALASFALVTALVIPAPADAQVDLAAPVFINEVHYDNAGTDVGEFIEVAGPAGTDLGGWTLELYNGSNGTLYDSIALSGVLADQANGFGTSATVLPTNGLQNGAPDGLALIAPGGVVVEFWSYEGTFAAVGGTADGVASTDMGVAELGADAAGLSLQLTGTGSVAGDFAWQAPSAESPGAVNAGQEFVGGPSGPADPVINEFSIDDASTDNEFVEVFGDASTDYAAYTVIQVDATGADGAIDHVVPVGTTDGSGRWVANLAANSLENGSSTLLLVEGFSGADGQDLDTDGDGTLDVEPWSRVVDAVAVDTGDVGAAFYGTPVLDESFDDARLVNGFGPTGASRIPDGLDTDAASDWYRNDFDWDGTTNGSPEPGEALNTPGQPNQLAAGPAPVVIINEVDADTVGSDVAEFVELYDGGAGNTALDGLVLVLFNGSNDLSYGSFDLDGQSTGPDGYFVLCGNAANVANCDLDVTPDGDLIQNGADAVALYTADAAAFPTGTAVSVDGLVDALVYDTTDADDAGLAPLLVAGGQVDENANGAGAVESNSRCPDGSGAPRDTSTYLAVTPTPGAANACDVQPPLTDRFIHEVQGSGPVAALSGQPVTVQAVVTSLFEDNDALDGFFIQEEDADADADPATSEGIFVFCDEVTGLCPADLAVGDLVTVQGVVTEFFGMSQIDVRSGSTVIVSSGNPLPTPAPVDLPAGGRTDAEATFENLEGMLVSFTDTLAVSEYFQLARFGQLVLTTEARPEQFTDANAPSVAGYTAFLDDLASRRIVLDDDDNDNNDPISGPESDEPYPWPGGGLSLSNRFRGGDTVTGLTGVLHWSFAGASGTDAWRVRPVDGIDIAFTSANPRPASPPPVGGSLRVASFNVLNYFTTIDEPGAVCGPSNLECRGANSAAELARQRAKIVAAMVELDADILGLIEIENDAGASADDLVTALNAATAPGTYAAVDTGSIGTDAIKVAFLYQPAAVTPFGDHAILDSSVDPRFIDDKNRPALIQTFEQTSDGARLTVAVNHLKSKGSDCLDVGDPDLLDGQGNCNVTRTQAAQALADHLATDPTGSGSDAVLIIGDLNAYAMEDPITALEAAGYTDLVEAFGGPGAYSYVFDGQLGYLDHALASPSLVAQVTGTAVWHVNADEPVEFDYNDDVLDPAEQSFERESGAVAIYAPDPYRSSDHDPVLIGLELAGGAASCNGLEATIVGTDAGETIVGTNGDDVIVAGDGNDTILGRGGNDVICGGAGNDRLLGQTGDDVLFGEDGDDVIVGGIGADTIDGGDGADDILGGLGDDVIEGGPGNDTVSASTGDDQVSGGPGNDALDGGLGGDIISGGADDDDLRGQLGQDFLDGGDGIDDLNGGLGQDTCVAGETLTSCEL